MDPVLLVTLIAKQIAENSTTEEVSYLGAIFSQLGDTLATIAAQREFCESIGGKSSDLN